MRFEDYKVIDYPATGPLNAMIWHLEELVPYMDNVAEIVTFKLEEQPDGRIFTERKWQGTASQVPALLRPFVSKSSLAWMDYGIWTPSLWRCEWRIENKHSRYSTCSGVNVFEPHPDAPDTTTRCTFAGDFVVMGDKIPAMPAVLGRKIAPKLESIIVGYMLPNFESLAQGLGGYLRAKAAAGQAVAAR